MPYYVVIKLHGKAMPVMAHLTRSDDSNEIILRTSPKKMGIPRRAKDFYQDIPLNSVKWLDGSILARQEAHAAGIHVLADDESLWSIYGGAYIKDRGAAGGHIHKRTTPAMSSARSKNLSDYLNAKWTEPDTPRKAPK